MADTYKNEEELQKEIGGDVRKILQGKSVRQNDEAKSPAGRPGQPVRDRTDTGPDIPPVMDRRPRKGSSRSGTGRMPETERGERRPAAPEPEKKRAGIRNSLPYVLIAYAFVLIFVLLIGHLVYYNLYKKDAVLDSPYNRRQNSRAEFILRGSILSQDGQVLAFTEVDEDGNEKRVYPYGNVFAHVVGYSTNGKSGIESFANYDLLTSHYNIIDQIVNEFMDVKNPGDNVVTTLDSGLQQTAYSALGGYQGAVVVLDPKTGAILAMVSKPDFDPNTLAQDWNDIISGAGNSQLLNRATQGLYPPGSTLKILTSLAYLREVGSFDDFTYDCVGAFEAGGLTVHCNEGAVHGSETFGQAFANSCNTAFSVIGLRAGNSMMIDTAKSLLFNEELPTELASRKSSFALKEDAGEATLVQTAFGQGETLVSPYHMALIASAIANDGVLMEPYLIDHVENVSGSEIKTTKAKEYKTLMSEIEAEQLKELMRIAVESGSAMELSGESYTAAGKTGSAEFKRSDGTIGTHSWFVGFTNIDNPDLVIAVLAEDGGTGSATAVPIAHTILNSYYNR